MKRAGLKTSEFWLVVYCMVVLTCWASTGIIDAGETSKWMMALVAAYLASRHQIKKKQNEESNSI